MNKLIKRDKYLLDIIKTKDDGNIKILTGVRRSGKSTILKLIMDEYLNQGIRNEQIMFITFESEEWDFLRKAGELSKYVKQNAIKNGKTYLFIDEIQDAENWARSINSIRIDNDIDIYITGSNSKMFIGEHTTYITGRYITFNIYPLSYFELFLFNPNLSKIEQYNTWLESSFPGIVSKKEKSSKTQMMLSLKESAFIRDVIQRGPIKNISQFNKVASFIFSNIGSISSIKKITDTLKSSGDHVSYNAVENYIDLLCSAHLLYKCDKYDLNGRGLLKTNSKYYSVDVGLSRVAKKVKTLNQGSELENFVFLELKKAGYDVNYTVVARDYEIDFIATKNDEKMYIQVSLSILSVDVLMREKRPFDYIKTNAPKYILTLDEIEISGETYKHMNVFDFIESLI